MAGGVEYIDLGWDQIQKEYKAIDKRDVAVGVFDPELADIATYLEYGTEHMPPRPFMRQADVVDTSSVVDDINSQKEPDLDSIGKAQVKNIVASIDSGNFIPNQQGTRPLIATGTLRASIDYVVE